MDTHECDTHECDTHAHPLSHQHSRHSHAYISTHKCTKKTRQDTRIHQHKRGVHVHLRSINTPEIQTTIHNHTISQNPRKHTQSIHMDVVYISTFRAICIPVKHVNLKHFHTLSRSSYNLRTLITRIRQHKYVLFVEYWREGVSYHARAARLCSVNVCMYVCVRCIYVSIWMVCLYMCVYMCVYLYFCMCACMYVDVFTYARVCIHVCLHNILHFTHTCTQRMRITSAPTVRTQNASQVMPKPASISSSDTSAPMSICGRSRASTTST
jgi:hypothetical protein